MEIVVQSLSIISTIQPLKHNVIATISQINQFYEFTFKTFSIRNFTFTIFMIYLLVFQFFATSYNDIIGEVNALVSRRLIFWESFPYLMHILYNDEEYKKIEEKKNKTHIDIVAKAERFIGDI